MWKPNQAGSQTPSTPEPARPGTPATTGSTFESPRPTTAGVPGATATGEVGTLPAGIAIDSANVYYATKTSGGGLAESVPLVGGPVSELGTATYVGIAIDCEPIPDAVVRDDRPTDPGRHEVRATAPGYVPASASVLLAEGETKTLSLQLSPVARKRNSPCRGAVPSKRPTFFSGGDVEHANLTVHS